jgi:hypothetical protein
MAGKGGRRPGAGRKPARRDPVTQSPIRSAELTLASNLPKLVDVAVTLALGGDKMLLVYCIDRVLGKPTQPIDIIARVRDLAVSEGLTEAEAAEAVAEVERMLRSGRVARG